MKLRHTPIALTLALTTGMLAAPAFSDTYHDPAFSSETGVLTIPSVTVDGIPGELQDITLEPAGDNLWRVIELDEGKLIDVIEDVNLLISDSHPVQALLRVSGTFPSGCGNPGQIRYVTGENDIDIAFYYENDEWTRNPEGIACTQALRPFSVDIPLPLYGLPAGEYHYRVNGGFEGSFTLAEDNIVE